MNKIKIEEYSTNVSYRDIKKNSSRGVQRISEWCELFFSSTPKILSATPNIRLVGVALGKFRYGAGKFRCGAKEI